MKHFIYYLLKLHLNIVKYFLYFVILIIILASLHQIVINPEIIIFPETISKNIWLHWTSLKNSLMIITIP